MGVVNMASSRRRLVVAHVRLFVSAYLLFAGGRLLRDYLSGVFPAHEWLIGKGVVLALVVPLVYLVLKPYFETLGLAKGKHVE